MNVRQIPYQLNRDHSLSSAPYLYETGRRARPSLDSIKFDQSQLSIALLMMLPVRHWHRLPELLSHIHFVIEKYFLSRINQLSYLGTHREKRVVGRPNCDIVYLAVNKKTDLIMK